MTMARKCEHCERFIEQPRFLDLHISVYRSDGPDIQDAIEQCYGDFCDACVVSGEAVKALLSGLKYRPARQAQRTLK